ncbi:MAG: fimbrillin family protein [Rikenellaceae bacterium]|nr:fimbrillin family protein [Rikenellaceae bacterium]
MKKSTYIITAVTAIASLFAASCQNEENKSASGGIGELSFSPTVEDPVYGTVRGLGNNFFEEGNDIDVTIYPHGSNGAGEKYSYVYGGDGVFRGDPDPFYFSLDDNYIDSIIAIWPTEEIRKQGIVTDQSEYLGYQLADWLTAKASVQGVMPTNVPVPLNFVRENTMLEFELAGQNDNTVDISTLIIELQIEGKATAFQAYCGDDNGHAYLILEAGTEIESTVDFLIGTLTVSNSTDNYYIILSTVDVTLEAGKRYLVTLTPQGYDIDAYVYIGSWQETEHGIGIPFAPPSEDGDGSFSVETPQQLIAMSYLMRHYTDGITYNWPALTYNISPDIEITDETAELYIPIPTSLFTGQMLMNGVPVTAIEYGDGMVLELFINE